ncbi:quorum sensing histidine kinase QseC [Chimaeribacter arupi]|uniref:quorum sensing histidine kinase QseC n=1 Tax=Chimaeribacter arupi TaxID=2060066 RepID=UPI002711E687|nr:quorum sensing histidine kinase QseC [Chimaeribacter arupi]WKZ91754.1 quorum sensing histidine kinase QseC [Chimaeribacter arupi]
MTSLSLRARLILLFSVVALLVWSVASTLAWVRTQHTINELFDTQQMLFAKRLATSGVGDIAGGEAVRLPKTSTLVRHGSRGELEDDALAFAIFDPHGGMRLNDGENGRKIRFEARAQGFMDTTLTGDDDRWRLLWLTTPGGERIAVGQEVEYREDMAWAVVSGQFLPWLVSLPLLVLLMAWLTGRELAPLRQVAAELRQRAPEDGRPLATQRLPAEVLPLAAALNALFGRVSSMLVRERRFTSDAAHELRSPLAALRVQTEVAQLAGEDETMRTHALSNLTEGIDRATRLVDQLLTLSRLEALSGPEAREPVAWAGLVQQALAEVEPAARARQIRLHLHNTGTPPVTHGQALLLSLMLRNLLDNAVRYSPGGTTVTVTLGPEIRVEDQGPGMTAEHLARLGERFYRPPGQQENGSGLGLSIALRIAALHGLALRVENRPAGGLAVVITA